MKSINWRYALGEVIIVIIGISLAFSLNNWKERQADRQQREQYLSALKLDINGEIVECCSTEIREHPYKYTL